MPREEYEAPEYGTAEWVVGLIALADIHALLEVAASRRRILQNFDARNASERHVLEVGHRLRFGCCADELAA